jgi:hypothetical protein
VAANPQPAVTYGKMSRQKQGAGSIFRNGKKAQFYLQWTLNGKRYQLKSGTDDRAKAESLLRFLTSRQIGLPLPRDVAQSLGFATDKQCINPDCRGAIPVSPRTGLPHPRRKFCCDPCYERYYNKTYYRKTHPIIATKNCDNCGHLFKPSKTSQRFCSKVCCSHFHQKKDQRLIDEARAKRQAQAQARNEGGRPKGMTRQTREEGRLLEQYRCEFEQQHGTGRGAMLYACRKVYGGGLESRKALARGHKTLRKYRALVPRKETVV